MKNRLSLQLKWLHQAQFAGYYVAADAGVYEAAGLDVEIRVGGPGVDPERAVASGEADFAQGGGLESVLAGRAEGLPVVAVATVFQKTDVVYIARQRSGIRSLADFAGRRVSTWYTGIHLILRAMLKEAGIDPAAIEEVVQGGDMQPFLDGDVDIAAATFYNQLPKLRAAGIDDLVLFDPADHGVVIPRDPIITSERLADREPKLVGRFVEASLRGWQHAFDHQDQAVESVLRRDPSLDAGLQKVMIAEIAKLALWGDGTAIGLGYLSNDALRFTNDFLVRNGQLPPDVTPETAIRMDLWPTD
ncbi:ABC transporter substrate-binding protein [Kaistia geumhonensis]|uniref:Thiamine pyrimidine synthase n=1 Tax=Kaistia geumhonensis TaxID=410839 RepID=A0ABU0M1C0_9HYPH|nr:ABC transporter substrate-binding protein [Kaistia geumhonensis]MCX5480020.1 ABC transporter substrate-binding protein [Kaistia geumhonensis]MDQ0514752.1 NitT/TauT family transport system substrate-binding protein [Kaistia geumhonensis]